MAHLLIYGGTFDPIHHGHLIACRHAREALKADRVLLIPARQSPHKQGERAGATAAERLEMLRLAVEGEEGFAVDDRELSRAGPSYTIDTLRELQKQQPESRFTLLVGADQLPLLHTWHDIRGILAAASLAILPRPGTDESAGLAAVATHLGQHVADQLRTSLLSTPRLDISATQIRQRVRDGLSIRYLVPDPVADCIAAHQLYVQ